MKQSKTILALAGFAFTAALALPAHANEHCPVGYTLVGVDSAKDSQEAKRNDTNGDKYVCEKSTSGTMSYKDNHQKDKDKPKDKDKDKK